MVDPQALYVQLGRLVESMPDLTVRPLPPSSQQWLARAYALVKEVDLADAQMVKEAMGVLGGGFVATVLEGRAKIVTQAIHRALAVAEVRAPAAAQGAFIAAGSSFDALTALGKVLGSATKDLLIVDPYMDEKVLTDFASLARENTTLRLLADQQWVKPALKPAAQRWSQQYGTTRLLDARLSGPRSLHDRLIVVDGGDAWVLTQSFNAFAARSPASIVKSDSETAALKISYYEATWASASPL